MAGNIPVITVNKSKAFPNERLRIHYKKGTVSANINGFRFKDKDTKQFVIYMPALDISGYGETTDKAEKILIYNVQQYFTYLLNLPADQVQIELSKIGWKKGIFNKEYSKAYIDINGELQNFNAENDKVERVALTTA